jgi:hypothetical protein
MGLGGGDRKHDIRKGEIGTDDRTFRLRAERSNHGPGRTYTIVYRVTDRSGNKRDVAAQVVVPR